MLTNDSGKHLGVLAEFFHLAATWQGEDLRHAHSDNTNSPPPRPVRMSVPLIYVVGVHLNHESWRHSAPTDTTETLFDLVYSCRKETANGEVMVMTWEECGMAAPPCIDAGTNPETFEVTYQVGVFVCSVSHGCERISDR